MPLADGSDESFEEMTVREMAKVAEEAVRDLLRKLDPDHVGTGRFVLLLDAIDTKTGERIPDPYFLIGASQVEWETRGLLNYAGAREDFFTLDFWHRYDEEDYDDGDD